ncbi:MAG: hypothetical protein ACJ74K_04955, partial [Actinomycetes bacterium]
MHDLAGRGPAQESGWLAGRLRLGVGHASTVRPDPATLDASDTQWRSGALTFVSLPDQFLDRAREGCLEVD